MSQFVQFYPQKSPIVPSDLSGVKPGTYGDASHFPRITIDASGRITAIDLIPVTAVATTTGGVALVDNDGTVLADNDGTVLVDNPTP